MLGGESGTANEQVDNVIGGFFQYLSADFWCF